MGFFLGHPPFKFSVNLFNSFCVFLAGGKNAIFSP